MSSKRSNRQIPHISGSHRMTWRELVEADDYATTLTVDPFLGFKTHKMTEMRLRIRSRVMDRLRTIITDFQKHKDYLVTYDRLISEDIAIKQHWKGDQRFRDHIFRYLLLFDDRSGITIAPCSRYASEGHIGGAIFATKNWPKGSKISSLVGCIAELNYEDEVSFLRHKKNDFSVMYSSRKNKSQLWLGPAAYVNHDCRPNCAFTINCDGDDRMSLTATSDIKSGDEIYIYYGKHFFDTNNASCECFTCELLERGSFSTNRVAPPATSVAQFSSTEYPSSSPTSSSYSLSVASSRAGDKPTQPMREDELLAAIKERLRKDSQGQSYRISHSSSSHPSAPLAQNSTIPKFRGRNSAKSPVLSTTSSTCTSKGEATATASISGFLVKGLSTGLACKANTAAYSLRHTNSRLTRVKAKIYSAMLSSFTNSQPQQQTQSKPAKPTRQEGVVLRPRRSTLPPLSTDASTTPAPPATSSSLRMRTPVGGKRRSRVLSPPTLPTATVKRRRCSQRVAKRAVAATSASTAKTDETEPSLPSSLVPRSLSRPSLLSDAPSPSPSSASTIAATEADKAEAVQMASRRRSRLAPRRVKSTLNSRTPTACTYSFRQSTRPKPPSEPILIDLALESTSTCSSLSTCPAVSTTPRLIIVRKRSCQDEEDSPQNAWFVREESEDDVGCNGDDVDSKPPPPPPILHTSAGGGGGGGGRGWATSSSSVNNTPSPPHLQAVSPTPPMLQRAEDRILFSLYAPTSAPALDSDGVSEGGSSVGTVKPLTVKIKRMGRTLYCVPPEANSPSVEAGVDCATSLFSVHDAEM